MRRSFCEEAKNAAAANFRVGCCHTPRCPNCLIGEVRRKQVTGKAKKTAFEGLLSGCSILEDGSICGH
ncbi:hypothetical protein L596_000935 [Steinernema carpocapsae]|uniref:Uncharacterized protein n=1 Tax=Steinernema carpocapsae TaxID=34508 RepID=A0A4U8ULW1_STECR|nr:hypothetical protein L596_000935 [Steinernema carpocapsae]